MPVSSWSTTAADNDDADSASGIAFAENQAPGSVNDSMRSLMAVIKGDFAKSHANPGYQKFPNGLIVQWGSSVITLNSSGAGAITLPIAFPSACWAAVAMNGDNTAFPNCTISLATPLSVSSLAPVYTPNPGVEIARVNWLAVGS